MKTIILIILISINLIAFSQDNISVKWFNNIDSAKADAQMNNKIILMDFSGSDWCANCIRLEKTLFQTQEFTYYAIDKLTLLKLDFPSKKKNTLPKEQIEHNEKLAEKYNKQGVFPTVLFLDVDENVLGKLKQPQNSVDDYLKNINSIITSK